MHSHLALLCLGCLGAALAQDVILDGADYADEADYYDVILDGEDPVVLDGTDDIRLGQQNSGQVRVVRPGETATTEFLDYMEAQPTTPSTPETVDSSSGEEVEMPERTGDALLFPTQYPPVETAATEASKDGSECDAWTPLDESLVVRHSAPGTPHVFAILKCASPDQRLVYEDADGSDLPGLPADILRCRLGKWTSRHYAQSHLSPAKAKCL